MAGGARRSPTGSATGGPVECQQSLGAAVDTPPTPHRVSSVASAAAVVVTVAPPTARARAVVVMVVVVVPIVVVVMTVEHWLDPHPGSPPSDVLEISTGREIWEPRLPGGPDAVEVDDPVGDGRQVAVMGDE